MTAGAPIGNKNAEKWTEKKALKLGNDLIDWLNAKDEEGEDKGNIFFKEFLVIENDLYQEIIDYLCEKYKLFFNLIKRAKAIQETKLVKFGLADRLQTTMAIFVLKNHHDYKDRKEIDNKSSDGSMTPIVGITFDKRDEG